MSKSPQEVFFTLYDPIDGMELSRQAREDIPEDRSLIYGEVSYDCMAHILSLVPQKEGDYRFCDLGSGTGKAVVLAALLGSFTHCVGVEKLSPLHEVAQSVAKQIDASDLDGTEISYLNQDINDADLSDTDVVFVHATCFEDPLIKVIKKKVKGMKKGSILCTVTQDFSMGEFDPIHVERYPFSWGDGTIYIQEKVC